MDSRCSSCGEPLILVSATQEMLDASTGAPHFLQALEKLSADITIEDIHIGFCASCNSNVIIGPPIMIEGTVEEITKKIQEG